MTHRLSIHNYPQQIFPECYSLFTSSDASNCVEKCEGKKKKIKILCNPIINFLLSFSYKEYIDESPRLREFFERLINADKKLFLVTNSPFHFV
jgi:hypothetical protein